MADAKDVICTVNQHYIMTHLWSLSVPYYARSVTTIETAAEMYCINTLSTMTEVIYLYDQVRTLHLQTF